MENVLDARAVEAPNAEPSNDARSRVVVGCKKSNARLHLMTIL
ncbi:hypothetical protein [Paraburkholderia sp. BCC1886]|nr:hypothetical protein [Paraburkholderia sp. BCC1886]